MSRPLSASSRLQNVPVLRRPLIGREAEQEAIWALLQRPDSGLVTLIGPGGVGKTRLSLQIAARARSFFADGVCFVALAACASPEFVLPTIAQALGVRESGEQPLLALLQAFLAERRFLLILDNWEHVLGASGLVAELLASAPGLIVLATSRIPLHLHGEQEYPLLPLPLPSTAQAADPVALAAVPAVALFLERARAVQPGFALTPASAPVVAAICARLDGLPLALELAAARLKLLSVPALLARLDRRLQVLTGGARDLPDRQQTLRATLDWSYALLKPSEQVLLARLGVFADGGTVEAIEAICGAGDQAPPAASRFGGEATSVGEALPGATLFDTLGALVDHSLVQRDDLADEAAEPRFRLLALIREYALERLEERGEGALLRARHAAYFAALAEESAPHLIRGAELAWQRRLLAEDENLRAALRWASEGGDPNVGLRLAGALGHHWTMRGAYREGRAWLAPLLDRTAGEAVSVGRALALYSASLLSWRLGAYDQAQRYGAASLASYRALGDRDGSARLLRILANIRMIERDYAAARGLLEEAQALLRGGTAALDLARVLNSLGELARIADRDYVAAERYYREALLIERAVGTREGLSVWLNNLGAALLRRGVLDEATDVLRESLELRVLLQHQRGIAIALELAAALAVTRERDAEAARFYGVAERLREVIAAPLASDPADEAEVQHYIAIASARLGAATWAAAWAEGRQLSTAAAVDEARALYRQPVAVAAPLVPPAGTPSPLTRREGEIAVLIARGLSNRAIAETLSISEKTAANHIDHIMTKLDFHSRAQIAAWVIRRQALAEE